MAESVSASQVLDALRPIIDPDFGKDHHDIVVDSWTLADDPKTLSEVRMWWLHSEENDEREAAAGGLSWHEGSMRG